jgi:PAS domain S-box-containing protein
VIRALIVDDEPELLEIAKVYLEKNGDFEIIKASSAKEALELLSDDSVDAIVSDYQMPELTGIDLLREIRSRDDMRPFVLFTGKGREEVAMEALNLGADRYIQKGIDLRSQFELLKNDLVREVERYRIQDALWESEERLELATKVAEYGIWDWDLDTDEIYFNDRYYTMLGYDPGELPMSLDTWKGLMHPEDREGVVPFVEESVSMGIPYEVSFRLRAKNGEWRWISGRGKVVERDQNGVPHRMLGTHVDITEQRAMEEVLRESEARFRMIVDLAPVPVLIHDTSTILFANREALKALGVQDASEIVGHEIFELVPDRFRESMTERIGRIMESGERLDMIEERVTRFDGTEMSAMVTGSSVLWEGKRAIQVVFWDVSEMKYLRTELQRVETRYADLIRTANSIILEIDREGRIQYINRYGQEFFGYSEEEIVGEDAQKILIPGMERDGRDLSNLVRGVLESPDDFKTHVNENLRRNGERAYVSWSNSPIKNDSGEMVGMLAVGNDVTEIKGKEEENRQLLHDLAERHKELNILYEMARIGAGSERPLRKILASVVELIPEAWHYPEATCGRIMVGEEVFTTSNFTETEWRLSEDINVDGEGVGRIDVFYLEEKKGSFEGPFLKEERQLIDTLADLLGSIIDRSRKETRIKHLNDILRGIRNVNQLITREADRDRLIEESCRLLTEREGYHSAWISLFDDDRRVDSIASSGFDGAFDPMRELLAGGGLTQCARKALDRSTLVVKRDPVVECEECPLAAEYGDRSGYAMQLEFKGRRYGLLSASVPREMVDDVEERELFEEVAGDIGFALFKIEMENERERIQETLRESEERFRSYIENCPLGVFVANLDGRYLEVNTRASEITGYNTKKLLSMRIFDILPPEGHDVSEEHFRTLKEEGLSYGEAQFLTKEGDVRWWTVNAVRLDEDRFLGFTEDITERKEMERELHLTRFSMENANLGLYWITPEGRFLHVNKGARDMLGYSLDELVGKWIWDLDPLPEHGREKREERWRLLKEVGELTFDSTHINKEGEPVDVEVTARYLEFDGKQYEFAFAHDITERVRAERGIRSTMEHYMRILNTMDEMVMIIGEDGRFIEVNDAAVRIFGYSREEFRTMRPSDIDVNADEERVRGQMDIIFKEGELSFESVHSTRDGREFESMVNAIPFDHYGKRSILCVMQDISDWKGMERDLRLTNEKLNMVGAITRHDIINQMTNLMGYVELAIDGGREGEYLEKALDASEKIMRIMELGEEYERLGTESARWSRMRDAIDTGLETVDLGDTGIDIDVDETEVFADPMLEKVFHNLVDNAIRHGKASRISIRTEDRGNELRVIVEDDGMGISQERRKALFEPSAGYGLHFSRELVSITGVDIVEESEGGEGARFVIIFPEEMYR